MTSTSCLLVRDPLDHPTVALLTRAMHEGPIAYSPRDIELYIYTVMDAEPWRRDVSLAPLKLDKPWSPSGRKWRIGWMKDDRIVRPHPPILRGM